MENGETLLADLELWEYVIKPALEYDGTIEELGYTALETPHGTIYLSNDAPNVANLKRGYRNT